MRAASATCRSSIGMPSAAAVCAASSRVLSALRASPPARRAIASTTSSATSTSRAAAPRRITSPSSSSPSDSSSYTVAAREERRVDLEVRVLGRRADQRHEPVLDRRQQRVLLRLVEAVDLVEEEDRPLAVAAQPVAGPRDHAAHVVDPRRDRRQLLEGGARSSRPRSARASSCRRRAARRGSSTAARSSSIASRSAERSAEHVRLADELVERARPQPLRERRRLGLPLPCRVREEVAHAEKYAQARCPSDAARGLSRSRFCRARARSDYERYLNTEELLALQKTADEWVHRDELLFQTVHQSSELWLKLAWHEVEAATAPASTSGDVRRRAAPAAPRRRSACSTSTDPARHARADVAVGVPGDPPGARPRLRLRLARASGRSGA